MEISRGAGDQTDYDKLPEGKDNHHWIKNSTTGSNETKENDIIEKDVRVGRRIVCEWCGFYTTFKTVRIKSNGLNKS